MTNHVIYNAQGRIIRVVRTSATSSQAGPGEFELVGVEADPRTQMVDTENQIVIEKPAVDVSITPLSIGAGESVTITTNESVRIRVNSEFIGQIEPGSDTLEFPDSGNYLVEIIPLDQLKNRTQFQIQVS